MAFTNIPKTEEELNDNSGGAWEDGQYPFVVKTAEEGQSKRGNNMITLELEVYKGAQVRTVRAWLVFMESMQWQVRRFYESIGGLNTYESGQVDATKLIGKEGQCLLTSEEGEKDGVKTGKFYNRIDTYEKPEAGAVKAPAKAAHISDDLDEEDDIPFNGQGSD